MVRHMVFWNLADKAHTAQNAAIIKEKLEALVGVIPGLISAEVGAGYDGFDAGLCSVFESREALAAYKIHPAHKEAQAFVHSVVCERVACDYDIVTTERSTQ